VLKHDVLVVVEITDVKTIPFYLTVGMLRQKVVAAVGEEKSSLHIGWITIGVGKLVMKPMSFHPIMNTKQSRNGLTEYQENIQSTCRLEASMREISMSSDRGSEPANNEDTKTLG
jgi:hypothetical protein